MRFVIYDDESLEPITVVNLPLTDKDIEARGRRWRLPVPEDIRIFSPPPTVEEMMRPMRIVEIDFERLIRRTGKHGDQHAWMAITSAADLAMLLKPDWLPGQRSAVQFLQDQNDALVNLLMRVG